MKVSSIVLVAASVLLASCNSDNAKVSALAKDYDTALRSEDESAFIKLFNIDSYPDVSDQQRLIIERNLAAQFSEMSSKYGETIKIESGPWDPEYNEAFKELIQEAGPPNYYISVKAHRKDKGTIGSYEGVWKRNGQFFILRSVPTTAEQDAAANP